MCFSSRWQVQFCWHGIYVTIQYCKTRQLKSVLSVTFFLYNKGSAECWVGSQPTLQIKESFLFWNAFVSRLLKCFFSSDRSTEALSESCDNAWQLRFALRAVWIKGVFFFHNWGWCVHQRCSVSAWKMMWNGNRGFVFRADSWFCIATFLHMWVALQHLKLCPIFYSIYPA